MALNDRVARGLLAAAAAAAPGRVQFVSRSDSTLRGHVMAEVEALQAARRAATGRGFDGVLLAPAFLEAGRLTAGDIHWARVAGDLVPVGETEFAQDATFGYTASDLRDFIAEKSGGAVRRDDVLSLSLADIRGADRSGSRAAVRGAGRPVGGGQRHRVLRPGHGGLRGAAGRAGRALVRCSGPGPRSCARWPAWGRGAAARS